MNTAYEFMYRKCKIQQSLVKCKSRKRSKVDRNCNNLCNQMADKLRRAKVLKDISVVLMDEEGVGAIFKVILM